MFQIILTNTLTDLYGELILNNKYPVALLEV